MIINKFNTSYKLLHSKYPALKPQYNYQDDKIIIDNMIMIPLTFYTDI